MNRRRNAGRPEGRKVGEKDTARAWAAVHRQLSDALGIKPRIMHRLYCHIFHPSFPLFLWHSGAKALMLSGFPASWPSGFSAFPLSGFPAFRLFSGCEGVGK